VIFIFIAYLKALTTVVFTVRSFFWILQSPSSLSEHETVLVYIATPNSTRPEVLTWLEQKLPKSQRWMINSKYMCINNTFTILFFITLLHVLSLFKISQTETSSLWVKDTRVVSYYSKLNSVSQPNLPKTKLAICCITNRNVYNIKLLSRPNNFIIFHIKCEFSDKHFQMNKNAIKNYN